MPQLTLEYSPNIVENKNMSELFKKCHETLTETLPTDIRGCKSRAIERENFYIGDGSKENAFVHLTLQVLPGRTTELLEKVAAKIMELLKTNFSNSLKERNLQITLALEELPKLYFKVAS